MKKGERRKQELLQIAYRMFLQKGYEETSVDEIIAQAGIAKGTYYYYFETKEQMLEEVIGMMISQEMQAAEQILHADLPVPQKIVGIVTSLRPAPAESPIEDALIQPENIIMHGKVRKKLIEAVTPLLSEVVEEGITKDIFSCDLIPERVRMLLILSSETFDEGQFSESDIEVFIDIAEKLLGAKTGTMQFVRELIR